MPLIYAFPEFHKYAEELDQLFIGDHDHYREHEHRDTFQQTLPDRLGFITYYSLKNRDEDFAEVFRYFILHNRYISETATAKNRRPKNLKKPHQDKILSKKYEFMMRLIEQEGIQIGTDALKIEKYKYIEINTN